MFDDDNDAGAGREDGACSHADEGDGGNDRLSDGRAEAPDDTAEEPDPNQCRDDPAPSGSEKRRQKELALKGSE